MAIDDEKKPNLETAEIGIKPPVAGAGEISVAEKQAAGTLVDAEKTGKERIKEALEKRFILLAEDSPMTVNSLKAEFKSAGGEQLECASTLEEVTRKTDDFIARVERGELDKTILTIIADLEYPEIEDGAPDAEAGLRGIEYVRSAIEKHNANHADKPLQVEVILNSTRKDIDVTVDAVSRKKDQAVNILLEFITREGR